VAGRLVDARLQKYIPETGMIPLESL